MSQTTPTIITTTLPSMTPFAFLNQLPLAHDLPDDSECPICVQQYGPGKAAAAPGLVESLFSMVVRREPEAIETERAVRLPCQHVLGWQCVRRWIHPKGGNQNTCPYVSAPSYPCPCLRGVGEALIPQICLLTQKSVMRGKS